MAALNLEQRLRLLQHQEGQELLHSVVCRACAGATMMMSAMPLGMERTRGRARRPSVLSPCHRAVMPLVLARARRVTRREALRKKNDE
jgi:hypothetical protein